MKIYQDLLPKHGLKFMICQKKIIMLIKKLESSMLRSHLCDFSDAFIVVKGDITLEGDNDANKRDKSLAFKNNAPFINWSQKLMV